MNAQWLAIQSFQRGQQLLTAINTLSIHTKLRAAGHRDEGRIATAARAREEIAGFLESFTPAAEQAEREATRPLLGLDSRLCQLAREFAYAKSRPDGRDSVLFCRPLRDTARMIREGEPRERDRLLECLGRLRELVEEHVESDASEVFGEI